MSASASILAGVILVLAASFSYRAQDRPTEQMVSVTQIDGSLVNGKLISLNNREIVVDDNGNIATLSIESVRTISFQHKEPQKLQPIATPLQQAAFDRCLRSFHRLLNATEMGISYVDYGHELLNAKTELDEAISVLPNNAPRGDIEEAMRDFMIAGDAWQIGLQYNGIPTKSDFFRSLNGRYHWDLNPRRGVTADYHEVLRLIWEKAAWRLADAVKLQQQSK